MVRIMMLLLIVLPVLSGCAVQQAEPTQKPEASRAEDQQEEEKPTSFPTFTYRPGGGLKIEGR